jgi:hypothetical protein
MRTQLNSPFLRLPRAVTFLSEYIDGDIALPTSLPSNVHLDVSTSVRQYVSVCRNAR